MNDATRAVYSCLVKCTMYITKQVYQVPLDTNLNKKKNLEWNQRPTQHEPFSTVANCRAYIMKQVNQLALNIIHKEIEVPWGKLSTDSSNLSWSQVNQSLRDQQSVWERVNHGSSCCWGTAGDWPVHRAWRGSTSVVTQWKCSFSMSTDNDELSSFHARTLQKCIVHNIPSSKMNTQLRSR